MNNFGECPANECGSYIPRQEARYIPSTNVTGRPVVRQSEEEYLKEAQDKWDLPKRVK